MASNIAAKVLAVLEPPERKSKDGLMVTESAYYNLMGALEDLKHQKADRVCIDTIERVLQQIGTAINMLQEEG